MSKKPFSASTSQASAALRKPSAQERQLAAPLPDAAQQDHGEPQRAHNQPQAAQGLEGGEIGVFHGQEGLQPLFGPGDDEAVIAQRGFQQRLRPADLIRSSLYEEKLVSLVSGIEFDEVRIQ